MDVCPSWEWAHQTFDSSEVAPFCFSQLPFFDAHLERFRRSFIAECALS